MSSTLSVCTKCGDDIEGLYAPDPYHAKGYCWRDKKIDQLTKENEELKNLLLRTGDELNRLLGDDNGYGEIDDCEIDIILNHPLYKNVKGK